MIKHTLFLFLLFCCIYIPAQNSSTRIDKGELSKFEIIIHPDHFPSWTLDIYYNTPLSEDEINEFTAKLKEYNTPRKFYLSEIHKAEPYTENELKDVWENINKHNIQYQPFIDHLKKNKPYYSFIIDYDIIDYLNFTAEDLNKIISDLSSFLQSLNKLSFSNKFNEMIIL